MMLLQGILLYQKDHGYTLVMMLSPDAMQEAADASETGRCDDNVVAKSENEALEKAKQR